MHRHLFSTAKNSEELRLLKANYKLSFRLLLWPLFSEVALKRSIKVLFIIFTMIVAGLFLPSPIANAPEKKPGAEACSCILAASSCMHKTSLAL